MGSNGPLIFRVASWPIETIARLRSAQFSADVDALIAGEEELHGAAVKLCDALFQQVPLASNRAARSAMLRVRRHLFRGLDPLAEEDLRCISSTAGLSARFLDEIAHHNFSRRSLRQRRQLLELRYPTVLAAERQYLFEVAGESRFRKALLVASPSTAVQWERCHRAGASHADDRLIATLWGYLMRAAGRATPHSLWAGVTIEDCTQPAHEAQLIARASQAIACVKPDLNVFHRALCAMKTHAEARDRLSFRLNPTLTPYDGDAWRYLRERDGDWAVVEIGSVAWIGDLRSILLDEGPMRLERLAMLCGVDMPDLLELVSAGVLWAVPDLPEISADPWDALERLCRQLPDVDRQVWVTTVERCHRGSRELSARWLEYEPDDVSRIFEDMRACLNELLERYGAAPVGVDRCPVIVDSIAPFRIAASESLRNQVADAVRRCYAFDRGGTGELQARDTRRQLGDVESLDDALRIGGFVPEHAPATTEHRWSPVAIDHLPENCWEAEVRTFDDPASAEEFLAITQEWTDRIGLNAYERAISMSALSPCESEPVPPGAALVMVRMAGERAVVRVGSISSDCCAFYSRFQHNFHAARDPFRKWLGCFVTEVEQLGGLALIDCAAHGGFDRNAALRPQLTRSVLNPFGEVRVPHHVSRDSMGRLDLRREGARARSLPLINSAVDLSRADPYSAWLQAHAQLLGRPALLRPLPPLAEELDTWRHLPQLELDGDVIISAERWHLAPDESTVWASLAPFERFVAWRKSVSKLHLPDLVYSRVGRHHTDSLLPADSTLGVEVLARSVKALPGWIRLQALFARPEDLWLRDSGGAHYVAEVAVAWSGDEAFWRSLAAHDG